MKNHRVCFLLAATIVAGFSWQHAVAQCRPGYGGPATVTWNDFVFTSTTPQCVADVTVTYCFSGHNIAPMTYDILSVILKPHCPGDSLLTGAMVREIGYRIVQTDKAAAFPCPQCPDTAMRVIVQWVSCFRLTPLSGDTHEYMACPGAQGACMDFYTVCCLNGERQATFWAYTPTGDCTDPDCLPMCPP